MSVTTNTHNEFSSFSEWAYHHSVILGHTLVSVKNEFKHNIEWRDTITGEVFKLTKKEITS